MKFHIMEIRNFIGSSNKKILLVRARALSDIVVQWDRKHVLLFYHKTIFGATRDILLLF